ncbi:MAG TPA: DUF3037 domain-containing protein [Terriglobales bacterium]|nr:DUF3037 domain-containing protein [Terriglobales bacterium]
MPSLLPANRTFEVLILRYFPEAGVDYSIVVGIVINELTTGGHMAARFERDWSRIRLVSSTADIPLLQAFAVEVCEKLATHDSGKMLLHRIKDSFSNAIQVSSVVRRARVDLDTELDRLASLYLGTYGSG